MVLNQFNFIFTPVFSFISNHPFMTHSVQFQMKFTSFQSFLGFIGTTKNPANPFMQSFLIKPVDCLSPAFRLFISELWIGLEYQHREITEIYLGRLLFLQINIHFHQFSSSFSHIPSQFPRVCQFLNCIFLYHR